MIIYTDHRTLENFDHQKDLLRHQAQWQEFLAQYDYKIFYIPGEANTVANALSCLPDSVDALPLAPIAATLSIRSDPALLESIKVGYKDDPFCEKASNIQGSINGIEWNHGLLYIGNHLVIPRVGSL